MNIQHTNNQLEQRTFHPLRISTLALFIGIAGSAQISMASSTVNSSSQNVYGGISDNKSLNGIDGRSIQVSTNVNGTNTDFASGNASAREGLLSVSASASGVTVNNWNLSRFQNYARATWNDTFTVNASGLNGTSGYVIAQLGLSGSYSGALGSTGNGNSNEYYNKLALLGSGLQGGNSSACGGWTFCGWQDHFSWGAPNDFSNLTPVMTARIPIWFGSGTGITYTLDLQQLALASTASGGLGTSAGAQDNYTLSWNGITGVFDANGNPVTNFTTTSVSGYNYADLSAPVPLPATYGMLMSGLGLLGLAARRKQTA